MSSSGTARRRSGGTSVADPARDYKPRENMRYRAVTIRAHAARVRRLEATYENGKETRADLLPDGWRKWTLIDLSNCQHTASSFFEVENEHGVWGVLVCNNCGTQVHRECPHVSNSWNEEGSVLTCDNCGIDGT